MCNKIILLSIVLSCFVLKAHSSEFLYTDIVNHILDNSDPNVIPIVKAADPIKLSVSMTLLNIHQDNSIKNQLIFDTWMNYEWKNNFPFNPKDFNNITAVKVQAEEVWTPDISAYNGEMTYSDSKRNQVVFLASGESVFIPTMKTRTTCAVSGIGNTTCNIKVGSWAHDGNTISLNNNTYVDLSNFDEGSEFRVLEASAKKEVKLYSCCPEPYEDILFSITFERKD